MADGQETGLANFNSGRNYATIGIVQQNGVRTLKYEEDGNITPGQALLALTNTVWLRSSVRFDDINSYEYSIDGETFTHFGGAYKLRAGGYRGDMVGIYTFNNLSETGYVDVDYFHYDTRNR